MQNKTTDTTKAFNSMTGLFPVSKTLAFNLIPVGRTLENMQKARVFDNAMELAKNYETFKTAADRLHKAFIEKTLSGFHLKYLSEGAKDSLQEYADIFFDSSVSAREKASLLIPVENALKESVAKAFAAVPGGKGGTMLKEMASAALLKELLPATDLSDAEREAVAALSAYTTYTRPYFERRDAMYSAEEEGHTIPNRIIMDNLPLHLGNVRLAERLPEDILDTVNADPDLKPFIDSLQAYDIREVFGVSMYALLTPQSAIDAYNTLIGGFAKEDGTKVKGINELINEHNQRGGERLPKLAKLYKQILTERDTPSWVPESIRSDEEAVTVMRSLHTALADLHYITPDPAGWDLSRVWIRAERLSVFSHAVLGNWKAAENAIRKAIATDNPQKTREGLKGYRKRLDAIYNGNKAFSVSQVLDAVASTRGTEMPSDERAALLRKGVTDVIARALADADKSYGLLEAILAKGPLKEKLGQNGPEGRLGAGAHIKDCLDHLKEAVHTLAPFTDGKGALDGDPVFYEGCYAPLSGFGDTLRPVYDTLRNYLTKKPFSTEKIELTFDNPNLLNGWDISKLPDNRSLIFRDGKKYYLGILSAKAKRLFSGDVPSDGETIERGEVKFIPNPHMMLPKVAFPKKNTPPVPVTPLAANVRDKKVAIKDLTKNQSARMIDFFKEVIKAVPAWDVFGFQFKESDEYSRVSEFYEDVASQAYVMRYVPVSRAFVREAVEDGSLFLFEISCQDMLEKHHGLDGKYKTLLQEALSGQPGSPVRLCGGGTVYYRKASLPRRITHPAGIPIPNKNPDNPKESRTLPYDLIKDRRYTEDRFAFHVPVLIHPSADKNGAGKINARVRDIIRENPGMYVLGVNRGERNLLSIALTAPDGRIIEQRSLNVFDGFDYRRKIAERERERQDDRRNWVGVRDIKEIKAGYLSRAVGEIAALVRKHGCVVALERLNADFKNSRSAFEVNIYEQFERDLVNRLSLLTDKDNGNDTEKALQLTNPGKTEIERTAYPQNGVVLFVNPAYITTTDPLTGFVNRLDTAYSSIAECEALTDRMESFRFDARSGNFVIEFDYGKVAPERSLPLSRKHWTIETFGERVENIRDFSVNPKGVWVDKVTELTPAMKTLLTDNGVAWQDGGELAPRLKGKGADFWKELLRLVRLTCQTANWYSDRREWRLVGCTRDGNGRIYDSRTALQSRPMDADVNAAWNLARKAHLVLKHIREFVPGETVDPDGKAVKAPSVVVTDEEWFAAVQQ